MRRRHEQHPRRTSESLDGLFSDVPNQAITLREMLGVPHADHRIVDQREVQGAVHVECAAGDEDPVEAGRRGQERHDQPGPMWLDGCRAPGLV